jgi:hypothetical protein
MDWEQIQPIAAKIFRVWSSGGDLDWAEQAWDILFKSGLTDYEDKLERTQVIIRFLALIDFYYGFCIGFRQEYLEPDFWDWAALLEIQSFQIGQLIGSDSGVDNEQQALLHLVSEEELVLPALEQGFQGRKALFISLWRSSLPSEWNDPHDQDYLTDKDILNQQLPTGEFASRLFIG